MPAPAPRVSVVIPTFNRARLVCEAIDSALAQEGVTLEVVVVDDGSSDATPATLAARYGGEPRVRVVRKENGGTASARNVGHDRAAGALVSPFDSDDLMLPGRLAKMAAALDAHPEADLCFANSRYSGLPGVEGLTSLDGGWHVPPASLEDLIAGKTASPSSMLLRASALRDVRFEEGRTFAEDTEFLFRYFASGRRSVLLPEPLTLRRYGYGGGDAPNMSARDDLARRALLELQEAWVHAARRPRAARAHLNRRWAKFYEGIGDPRAVRPHLWAWWRARPWELRPLVKLVRSLRSAPPPDRRGSTLEKRRR